jgi:hypothetical protein
MLKGLTWEVDLLWFVSYFPRKSWKLIESTSMTLESLEEENYKCSRPDRHNIGRLALAFTFPNTKGN